MTRGLGHSVIYVGIEIFLSYGSSVLVLMIIIRKILNETKMMQLIISHLKQVIETTMHAVSTILY